MTSIQIRFRSNSEADLLFYQPLFFHIIPVFGVGHQLKEIERGDITY